MSQELCDGVLMKVQWAHVHIPAEAPPLAPILWSPEWLEPASGSVDKK